MNFKDARIIQRKTMRKAEAAWEQNPYKDIPQVTKTAFLEGFVEGYTERLKEESQTMKEYIHTNPEG